MTSLRAFLFIEMGWVAQLTTRKTGYIPPGSQRLPTKNRRLLDVPCEGLAYYQGAKCLFLLDFLGRDIEPNLPDDIGVKSNFLADENLKTCRTDVSRTGARELNLGFLRRPDGVFFA